MTKLSTYLWSLVLVASILSDPVPVKAGQIELVTNTSDDGPGSLRAAILLVDDQGEVLFDEAILGQSIILTSGSLLLTKDMSILCPIDNRITITAQGQSRIFHQVTGSKVNLEGLILTGGAILDQTSDANSLGGAIFSEGELNINRCDITKSKAVFGGGIYGNIINLSSSNIIDNVSHADGGGIYANELTAIKSTISMNRVLGRQEKTRDGTVMAEGNAGGIRISKKLDLYQCTISENTCGGQGGGICLVNGSILRTVSIVSCNISNNKAGEGGGIYDNGLVINAFSNNLVVQNADTASSPDLYFKGIWINLFTVHHNIIGAYTSLLPIPGLQNQIGSLDDPIIVKLGPLQYNGGGPTLTSALIECRNPAINAGDDNLSTTDQTGMPRKIDEQNDIGPWEHQDPRSIICPEENLEKYVILATSDVTLSNRNTVINGGVGVINPNGRALISNRSRVTAASTFVEAPSISVTGGSTVTTRLNQAATVQIPPFKENNFGSNNSVIIPNGATQILADGNYKDVTVRSGGTVIFESNQVYIEDLIILTNGRLIASDCTEIIVKGVISFGRNSQINIDNNRLSLFANRVRISNGNTTKANIQASVDITAQGSASNPVYLTGLFIAPRVNGRSYVNFNWNQLEACDRNSIGQTTSCDNFIASAGQDVTVLRSRFDFLNNYGCVNLTGTINGATGNYAYEWTFSNSLSDPTSLTIQVCPTTDTEYILNAKTEDGCVSSDTVLVKVVAYNDLFNQTRCITNRLWITMCNPVTKEEVCANIFSSSAAIGVGPLLNAGYLFGSCQGLEPRINETQKETLKTNEEFKIWPTPSYGSINFSLSSNYKKSNLEITIFKTDKEDLFFRKYKAADFYNKETITVENLDSGYYTYEFKVDNVLTNAGRFLVKEMAKN